jgi:Na+-translocating ferredoxin:NAD+ oxidoreductase subunit B
MKAEDIIYQELQNHLDDMPIGFPSAEDGSDIKVLKAFFSVEEAKLAICLNFFPVSLKKIKSQIKELSIEEIEHKLDLMVKKGLVYKEINPNTSKAAFGNLPYAIGIYENQVNRLTPEMAQASEEYGVPFIKEFLGEKTGLPQMRVIPINAAVSHENIVMDYEKARNILDSIEGPYAVAPCVCVQSKELLGHTCKHDMLERCMVNSQEYIDNGIDREITKAEAFDILVKAEEKGLVIQPGNSKDSGGFCLCCGCCCGILTDAKKLDQPARLFATNFYSEVDDKACTACETCVSFCPMDAIEVNETAIINRDRCIGCGVCVTKCPSGAIHLRNKEQQIIPPENRADLIVNLYRKKKMLKKSHTKS